MIVNNPVHDEVILVKARNFMLDLNPTRDVNHENCDWVIENFMDIARDYGCKMEPDDIAHYFFYEA